VLGVEQKLCRLHQTFVLYKLAAEAGCSAERMTSTAVPAIVLHWNNPEGALRSARSLREHAPECPLTILENGSPEPARQELEERAKSEGFHVLATGKNLGFAGGMNFAISGSGLCDGAEFALISCHGVEVTPGCVDKVVRAIAADERAGTVVATIRGDTLEYFGADPRWRERGPQPYVETVRVSGAQMVVRVSAFRAIGGFDERFFAYYEDVDLSKRLRAAGYRVGMVPDAEIVESGSTLPSIGRIYLIARNAILSSEHDGRRAKAACAVRTAVGSATSFLGSLAPWRPAETRRLSRLFARGQFFAALDGVAGVTGPGRAFQFK
jgi:GT2 family glycosyltransferase